MNNEIWNQLCRFCGPIAGSLSTDPSKIRLLEVNHYATVHGGFDLVERGMFNATQENSRKDGYGCIQIHYKLVKIMEKDGLLPKGTYDDYCEGTVHFEATTVLEKSRCDMTKAHEISKRHFQSILDQTKDKLQELGSSNSLVSRII